MRKIAEILRDRVRHVFEISEEAPLPEFGGRLKAVEITGMDPEPQVGWIYKDGSFVAAERKRKPRPRFLDLRKIGPAIAEQLKSASSFEEYQAAVNKIFGIVE
nr:hypothetical protein 17 [bacterium]